AVEVRRVGALRPAHAARAAGGPLDPPVVGALPVREVGVHLAEVEGTDDLLRPDAPVLPAEPAGGVDLDAAMEVVRFGRLGSGDEELVDPAAGKGPRLVSREGVDLGGHEALRLLEVGDRKTRADVGQ